MDTDGWMNVAGDMPVCGIYRHENKQPEMSVDDMLASAGVWHDSLVAAAPPSTEQVRAIMEKSDRSENCGSWVPGCLAATLMLSMVVTDGEP